MNKSVFNILEDAIIEYTNIYRRILRKLYPAIGSNGFEERNLTNNFVSALKISTDDDAIAWFETSLEGNKKIDATVFLPNNNAVLFLEAKRISNGKVKNKLGEIVSDFERLINPENQRKIMDKWKSSTPDHRYIIYLADVWTESATTKEIPEKWLSNGIDLNNNMGDKLCKPNVILSNVVNFNNFKNEFQYTNSLENYNLLIFAYKIS